MSPRDGGGQVLPDFYLAQHMHHDELDPLESESAEGGLNEETLDDFLEDESAGVPDEIEREDE